MGGSPRNTQWLGSSRGQVSRCVHVFAGRPLAEVMPITQMSSARSNKPVVHANARGFAAACRSFARAVVCHAALCSCSRADASCQPSGEKRIYSLGSIYRQTVNLSLLQMACASCRTRKLEIQLNMTWFWYSPVQAWNGYTMPVCFLGSGRWRRRGCRWAAFPVVRCCWRGQGC